MFVDSLLSHDSHTKTRNNLSNRTDSFSGWLGNLSPVKVHRQLACSVSYLEKAKYSSWPATAVCPPLCLLAEHMMSWVEGVWLKMDACRNSGALWFELHAPYRIKEVIICGGGSVTKYALKCITLFFLPAVWTEAFSDSLHSCMFTAHLVLFGVAQRERERNGVERKQLTWSTFPCWYDTKTPN